MAGLKVAVLVPDGAADLPVESLGGKTPFEAARIPNMDLIAASGVIGKASTVPPGMPPGSDVANLSLLGYDPGVHYCGRGPIEAANMGIEVREGWTAFRCNFVCTDGQRMLDYSAGHIGQDEASRLIEALESGLGDDDTLFHQGKSYRNLLLLRGDFEDVDCVPPHDITGEPLDANRPTGKGAGRVWELMSRSREVLGSLKVNRKRIEEGRAPVDMIWLWGQGSGMKLESFRDRFGLDGGVISAVDLINGLGRLAGLQTVEVPGVTGFLDTNYAGKGEFARDFLARGDFIFVHVEAPDEASHMGDVAAKVEALERFDELVVGPVVEYLMEAGDYRVLTCPDHPTFLSTGTHDASPVPYAACGVGIPALGADSFSEKSAEVGGPHFASGFEMMARLTSPEPWAV